MSNLQINKLHSSKNKNTSSRIEYFKKKSANISKNRIYTNYNLNKKNKNIISTTKNNKTVISLLNTNNDIYEFIYKNLLNNYKIFNTLLIILKENMDKINEINKKIKNINNASRISKGINHLRSSMGFKKKINNTKKEGYENVLKHLEYSKKNIIRVFIKLIKNDYINILNEIVKKLTKTLKNSNPNPNLNPRNINNNYNSNSNLNQNLNPTNINGNGEREREREREWGTGNGIGNENENGIQKSQPNPISIQLNPKQLQPKFQPNPTQPNPIQLNLKKLQPKQLQPKQLQSKLQPNSQVSTPNSQPQKSKQIKYLNPIPNNL